MGNRARIVFEADGERSPAVYLHWNGGPESVYAFLDATDDFKCRQGDTSYYSARFVQVVANFIGGTLSVGIDTRNTDKNLMADAEDNGAYLVSWKNGLRIVKRLAYAEPAGIGFRWLSEIEVMKEKKQAYTHPYHMPEEGKKSITFVLREKNTEFFKEGVA